MAFGFASDIPRIRARNPHLNLGVTPFPQPAGAARKLAYSSYFFPAVSRLSRKPLPAWNFVTFIASPEAASYLGASRRVPARRDLIAKGAPNVELDVFYRQTLIAKSWPIPDEQAVVRIMRDLIGALVEKTIEPGQAISQFEIQLRQVLP
jgi:ABC-type glycerol-3-phosphate transport system substrate-binding protein